MIVSNEPEIASKEAIVTYFTALNQNIFGDMAETTENLKSG
jgi:hypothetical protein